MSTLTALARALAAERGIAQPICTVRHVHVSDRPLVLIPLALAGEANAPLAAMVGADRQSPRLIVVHQPRNRDQRFAFAARLAEIVLALHRQLPVGSGRDAWAGGEPAERDRRRAADHRAEPGWHRLHPAARPVHQVPAFRRASTPSTRLCPFSAGG